MSWRRVAFEFLVVTSQIRFVCLGASHLKEAPTGVGEEEMKDSCRLQRCNRVGEVEDAAVVQSIWP